MNKYYEIVKLNVDLTLSDVNWLNFLTDELDD